MAVEHFGNLIDLLLGRLEREGLRMWWMMGEGGGHYCSKKTDDYCADVCGQVCPFFSGLLYRFGSFVFWVCVIDSIAQIM